MNVFSTDVWYIFDILQVSGTSSKLFGDGTLKSSHTTEVGTSAQPLVVYSGGQNAPQYADWALIRKFIATEPAFSSAGAEESAPGGCSGFGAKLIVIENEE